MARWRVAGRRVARWIPHRCHGSPAAGAGRVRGSAVAATPRLGWRLGRRCRRSGGRAVSDRTAGARRLDILPSDRERPILPPSARLPHRRRPARAVAPERKLHPLAPAREPFRRVAWSGTVRHSPAQRGPSDTSAEAAPVPTQSESNPLAGFGPNEWLVEEIYQQYLADPDSVDAAWHDFFADYRRNGGEPAENSAQVSDQPEVARKPAAAEPEMAPASEPPAARTPEPSRALRRPASGPPPAGQTPGHCFRPARRRSAGSRQRSRARPRPRCPDRPGTAGRSPLPATRSGRSRPGDSTLTALAPGPPLPKCPKVRVSAGLCRTVPDQVTRRNGSRAGACGCSLFSGATARAGRRR